MKHFLVLFLMLAAWCNAADYLGLESYVPNNWSSDGTLSMSGDHYKMGAESVKWDWASGDEIVITTPTGMSGAPSVYLGGMMLWVYSEVALDEDVLFQYKDDDGVVQYYFSYHIDFTGWRACWIRFTEDMSGNKDGSDLQTMHIIAPDVADGGTLYFDRMRFPNDRINDRLTPDKQLPYVNPEMNQNHWAALWHWESTYEHELPLPSEVTASDAADFAAIRTSILDDVDGSALSTSQIAEVQAWYDALQIERTGDQIAGVALVAEDEYVADNDDRYLDQIDEYILLLARGWYHNQESGFDDMFVDVLDWYVDQGFAYGSGMGTNHHYGYQFRNFPRSIYLLKDMLISKGKFDKAREMIQYWTGVPEVKQWPTVDNFQGIVDAWNTVTEERLMAIMLDDDSPEMKQNLQAYSRWMGAMTEYSVGTMGGFKPDGAFFHHGMMYANYANGGYAGLGSVLAHLTGTEYQLPIDALDRIKQGVMIHTLCANKTSIPNGISGRHPLTQSVSNGSVTTIGHLAKAYEPMDTALASYFLTVTPHHYDPYAEFVDMGIEPSARPVGNWSVNYGALNLHRRDEWLVATKGFNTIVTGTEIYTSNNRYGKYQGYGGVQILGTGDPVTAAESGIALSGWDWNRFPGTTTIHIPMDELRWAGDYSNNNERSDHEDFAGAVSLGGNGIFGMVLDENDNPNYTDDFVARKSVFAFDNRIVCMGTGVSNSNADNNTETTIFQAHLENTSDAIYIDGVAHTAFPFEETPSSSSTLMDNVGNAYYVNGGNVHVTKSNQESRDNQTSAVNYGDFATAWIDHGTSPNNASYEYSILVQTNDQELADYAQSMTSAASQPYEVLQKNADAHILKDKANSTTGYVLFEANDDLSSPHIVSNSYPCLVMVQEDDDNVLHLNMADPAINMEKPEELVHQAIVEERQIDIVLAGRYELTEEVEACEIIERGDNSTTLRFTCIHGLPINISLVANMPMLETLQINGIAPKSWSPLVLNTSLTLQEDEAVSVQAFAFNAAHSVTIVEPDTYPGTVSIDVSGDGVVTRYTVDVLTAAGACETLENHTTEDWFNDSFVGDNGVVWYLQNAKKAEYLGTGTAIYSYNYGTFISSELIGGGISQLEFDVLNKWGDGVERTIKVYINDELKHTETNSGTEVYKVRVENLDITGDMKIAIANESEEKAAIAIDNICWEGFAADRNALLADLKVNGFTLAGFDPLIEDYYYQTNYMATVTAEAASDAAVLTIDMPATVPGDATVEVVAEDGSWKEYTVHLGQTATNEESMMADELVSLYPSPTDGMLYLESTQEILSSTIFSIAGAKISSAMIDNSIDVSTLSAGTYLVDVVCANGERAVLRFIRQ